MLVIVWEYRIRPGAREGFEALYGPDGGWARLFRQHPGYLGTDLFRDTADASRYLTVDRWESAERYQAFRAAAGAEYRALDAEGDALTVEEREVGRVGA